ncbi:MAG: ROK family protein [Candidatus Omnitrophica bacterium]|nr:ROK family protein [Candidatus Omnitrophota bacterium]
MRFTALTFSLSSGTSYRTGIDLGGTKIEIAVLDEANHIVLRDRIPTEADKGYDHVLSNIRHLFAETEKKFPDGIKSVGMGTPGAISLSTGKLKNSNTQCMNNQPLQEDVNRVLQVPVRIQNDANCFALAEAIMGAGRGYDSVFGVIMGTGCGGGIVMHQKFHGGLQRIGGEWGHMSIDPAGPECYCGRRGCTETYISGGGLENRFFEHSGMRWPAEKIWSEYEQENPVTAPAMNQFFTAFGRSMGNLINILDPEVIVMGGGLSNQPQLYTTGLKHVAKNIFGNDFRTKVVSHQLGDSAGVIGAALL